MYTMNIATRSIETRVVGVTFENRQAVVAILSEGERVSLIREPDNPFDHNAVKVVRWDRKQIGYLDRDLARKLAPLMDYYGRSIVATVKRLMGGSYPGSSIGVIVRFYLPEQQQQ